VSRPHGEPGLRGPGLARHIDRAEGVDVDHVEVRGAGGQLGFGERVDLRTGEPVAVPGVGVCRQIDPVGVGPDVRIVAEVRAGVDTPGVRAVVRDVDPVDVPATGGIAGLKKRCVAAS
jgi:hypothetical protein